MSRLVEKAFVVDTGVLWVHWERNDWGQYRLLGTAALLVKGKAPVGVLLDRLEEHPDECEAPAEVVRAAVEWLRRSM